MKISTCIKALLFAAAFASVSALAADQSPVLGKSSIFSWGPYSFSYKCEIFSDVTVITNKTRDGQTTVEKREQTLDASALDLLAAAADGEVVESEGPTDVPSDKYFGFNQVSGEMIILGGQRSSIFITNKSPEAQALIDLVDRLCK